MGCACIKFQINNKNPVTNLAKYNETRRRKFLYSIKMEAWIIILDYLPYKELNVSGMVCRYK